MDQKDSYMLLAIFVTLPSIVFTGIGFLRQSSVQISVSSVLETTLEVLDVVAIKWKLLFVVFPLVVACICVKTIIQKLHRGLRKQLVPFSLIFLTPSILSFKVLIKLYYQPLSDFEEAFLDSVVELIGSMCLISFWTLFKEANRARLEPVVEDKRLLVGVYQYFGVRLLLSVTIQVLQFMGLFTWIWFRILVGVTLFVSEVVALSCLAGFCLLVASPELTRIFVFYKSYKYFVWLQEFIIFGLGFFGFLDLSKGGAWTVLHAAIILEMIAVSLLQHSFYRG